MKYAGLTGTAEWRSAKSVGFGEVFSIRGERLGQQNSPVTSKLAASWKVVGLKHRCITKSGKRDVLSEARRCPLLPRLYNKVCICIHRLIDYEARLSCIML